MIHLSYLSIIVQLFHKIRDMGRETCFGTARITECMYGISRIAATFAAIVRAFVRTTFASQLYLRFGIFVSRMVRYFQKNVDIMFLTPKKPLKKKKKIVATYHKCWVRVWVRAKDTSSASGTASRLRMVGPSSKN